MKKRGINVTSAQINEAYEFNIVPEEWGLRWEKKLKKDGKPVAANERLWFLDDNPTPQDVP